MPVVRPEACSESAAWIASKVSNMICVTRFMVRLRLQRGLREQHWVLLRRHAQLVVERVVPDLLHVIPVTGTQPP